MAADVAGDGDETMGRRVATPQRVSPAIAHMADDMELLRVILDPGTIVTAADYATYVNTTAEDAEARLRKLTQRNLLKMTVQRTPEGVFVAYVWSLA